MHKKSHHTNNPFLLALACVFCALFLSCDEQQPKEKHAAASGTATLQADTVLNYDSLITLLLELQSRILEDPANTRLFPRLVTASFDTISGSFLVVGRGVANQGMPEGTWNAGKKMAASLDAKNWALYNKSWRQGNMIPRTKQVRGTIAYSRVLFERENNDTLYQLLEIPIGSIVIQ